jgi:phosphoglucosamine mutase
MSLFGTSGIRRLADLDLVRLTFEVGLAVGTVYPDVVIGRDTRTSGSVLRHALTAGLLAAGARCSDAGVLPTPTLAFVTREFAAGVMITASHNPPQYNGLKCLNPDGSAFSARQQKQIADIVRGQPSARVSWERMQDGEVYSTAIEKHLGRIRHAFPGGLKLKVVVDAGCGAAYFITPHLLTGLGCEVTCLNCHANGIFPHDIEPVEANLGELISAVTETSADLGIAHDGDADRMMAVDNRGRFISGDKMLAILARASGARQIVTTVDASMSIESLGFKVKRTKVGDPFVSAQLKKWGGFGGEPSGAWVFPPVSLCPDGVFAAAQIVAIAADHPLSLLADEIPDYPVVRGNLTGSLADLSDLKDRLTARFQPDSFDLVDGLKLNLKNGWLLVRPSGTEPKIRITVEAKTPILARRYFAESVEIVQDSMRISETIAPEKGLAQ